MGLIDSHAHLTSKELIDQSAAVLERCAAAGVEAVITVGTTVSDVQEALRLAAREAGQVFVAAGIHPHEAGHCSPADVEALAVLWKSPSVVAIGEVGLDYHYDFADRETQRRSFAAMLVRAANVDLPLVIHCREAQEDTIALLLEHGFAGRRVVFHCFTGTGEDARRIAEHGWRVSFTGVVTFKKAGELREIARTYPLDQLMIETDSPFLSPEPVRSVRPNEPVHVVHVARFLANLRGVAFEDLVSHTRRNTRAFFGLPGEA